MFLYKCYVDLHTGGIVNYNKIEQEDMYNELGEIIHQDVFGGKLTAYDHFIFYLEKYGSYDNWRVFSYIEKNEVPYIIFDIDFNFNRDNNLQLNPFQFKILDDLKSKIRQDKIKQLLFQS